jgi:hypothetical protein
MCTCLFYSHTDGILCRESNPGRPVLARWSVQSPNNFFTRRRFSRVCTCQHRAANRSHSQMRKGDFVSYKCSSDVKVTLSEKPPSCLKGEPRPSLKIRCDWADIVCWVWTELYGRNMEPGACLLSFVVPLQHHRICHFFVHVELLEGEGMMLVFSWPCLIRNETMWSWFLIVVRGSLW